MAALAAEVRGHKTKSRRDDPIHKRLPAAPPGPNSFLPTKHSGGSKRIRRPRRATETGHAHPLHQFGRRRKTRHRSGQVSVRPFHSRDRRAHGRQHPSKIDAVKLAEPPAGFAALQNSALSPRPKQANNFAQTRIVVREIAKTKRRSHKVKRCIGKRQVESIGLNPSQASSGRLQCCPLQHGMREIRPENPRSPSPSSALQGKRHVPGPAAKIQNACVRTRKNVLEGLRGSPPPPPVDVE